jgi:hypothetical protein
MGVGQPAALLADGRADGFDDVGLCHGWFLPESLAVVPREVVQVQS